MKLWNIRECCICAQHRLDITYRVLRTLKEVDLIAAEDTRNSIKLLNHFEIKTPMTSYHEYNKVEKAKVLVEKMLAGTTVALITDAGTPGISDPGEELVRQCHEAGVTVTSLPGPAACITALTMSGRPTRRFAFEAFLPPDKQERKAVLSELKEETRTVILYEAPHRLLRTLKELCEVFGKDRPLTICKELTKRHEKVMQCTLEEACTYYEKIDPKGEFVFVVAGADIEELESIEQQKWEEVPIEEHMQNYLSRGMERKEAMKAVAKDRGMTKNQVYKELMK